MDGQDLTAQHESSSRPSLGFPLGTGLLLVAVFCLSGVFSCCYHWERLQSVRRFLWGGTNPDADAIELPSKSTAATIDLKQNENQSLPVLMPGDEIPKYIAWPCPCEPSQPHRIAVDAQLPSLTV